MKKNNGMHLMALLVIGKGQFKEGQGEREGGLMTGKREEGREGALGWGYMGGTGEEGDN